MRIFQLLPTLVHGDGIGNETLIIDQILKELGYETKIYAENIDRRIPDSIAESVHKMPELYGTDVVIYHLSTGTSLNKSVRELKCRIIIIYHNVTPPHFFEAYSSDAVERSAQGMKGVQGLADKANYCFADSYYNKQQLLQCGYQCKIDIVPIIVPFKEYDREPSKDILEKYDDDYVNIIFVGRVAPNKKQEDVIKSFYYYKKYINRKSRLFLVGSYRGMERYKVRLDKYVKALNLEDVYFTGHIKFDEVLAYYKLADIFLCMSEHEGFCIPLLEAMYFQVPIVAYVDTGVQDTLADCGFQMKEKNCKIAAEMIEYIMKNPIFRERIIEGQNFRLKEFSYKNSRDRFVTCMKKFLGEAIER